MTGGEALILVAGGFVAGTINTLAGGASSITVPLLVLVGLPGTVANGTNRIGIFVQSVWAALRFRAAGFSGFAHSAPILLPTCAGATLGAWWVSTLADRTFEQLFGIVMVLLLLPMLAGQRWSIGSTDAPQRFRPAIEVVLFFAIGVFGGAFQAGVGLLLLAALNAMGHDLVRANSIKVVVNAVLTAVAVPIFIWRDQVAWLPALFLTIGFIAGSTLGVRLAVHRGERVIRPAVAVAIALLAGRMLGIY